MPDTWKNGEHVDHDPIVEARAAHLMGHQRRVARSAVAIQTGCRAACREQTAADVLEARKALLLFLSVRPNNTFGFLVPEATFCREYAQNQVSGTRFCHFSRDRHTPEPPRYRAFCGFLAPDTCISGLFTAPSCLSARSCPVPDGGGCSRRVWFGPWSLW